MEQRHIKQIESAFALMSVEQRAAKIAELLRRNAPVELISIAKKIDRQLSAKSMQPEPAPVRIISPEEKAALVFKVRTIFVGVFVVGSSAAIIGLFVIPAIVAAASAVISFISAVAPYLVGGAFAVYALISAIVQKKTPGFPSENPQGQSGNIYNVYVGEGQVHVHREEK